MQSFKLLCVGNSFSDNITKYMYSILNSFYVKKIIIANLFIPGCEIKTHLDNAINDKSSYIYRKNTAGVFVNYDNYSLKNGLTDEKWDFVTMQQASGKSGEIETYNENINELYTYIKSFLNENCKIGWNMTWAYSNDCKHNEYIKYNNCQSTMYESIINCVKTKIITNKSFEFIAPLATTIQNARTSYLKDTFTLNDGYHLEDLGEFIVGLALVIKLTNFNIDDMDLTLIPLKFIPYIKIAKEAVLNSLKFPFSITPSIYDKDESSNKKEQYEFIKDISYNEYCKLDMYLPKKNSFDTIIHIHGGGLTSGSKEDANDIAKEIVNNGIGFITINYRFLNNNNYEDYFIDSSCAIKYVIKYLKDKNIKSNIYISGQSAGAYIAMMICFNNKYFKQLKIEPLDIKGYIIESGQATTHFNVLASKKLNSNLQRIDKYAPLYYINEKTKFNRILLIAYTHDIPCRLSQNKLLYDTIKLFNKDANINLLVLEGNHCENSTTLYRNRSSYAKLLLDFINNK